MTVIETIREKRETMNLPLRVMAEALNVDTSTWAKVEKGDRTLKLEMIEAVCEKLQLDPKKITVQFWAEKLHSELAHEEYASEILVETKKRLQK